jgi:hypothetical protein
MTKTNPTLEEARRIAGQPTGDKLDGKLADEAEAVILRLLEDAGLDYVDALRLLGSVQWRKWSEGWHAGYSGGSRKEV